MHTNIYVYIHISIWKVSCIESDKVQVVLGSEHLQTQGHKYKYKYTNTQIHKYTNTQIQIQIQIHKYKKSKLSWAPGRL